MDRNQLKETLRRVVSLKPAWEELKHFHWTKRNALAVCGTLAVLLLIFLVHSTLPPQNFPRYIIVDIEEGTSIPEATRHLEEEGVVRSSTLLNLALALFHKDEFIQAGAYRFDIALSVGEVAKAITSHTYLIPPTRVVIPEGLHGEQIAEIITNTFLYDDAPELSPEAFDEHIGYLFPDTYYIPRDYTEQDFIELMRRTYEQKVGPLRPEFEAKGFTEAEVINLASIIEREASTMESKRRVAGILLNRLAIDMPLQVDATFYYLFEKTSAELTRADLATDSPYNTYLYRGLPPTPIANPGLDSITAVLDPIPSEDLFYLTAPDGTFYYAETNREHEANKSRYLR